MRINVESDFVSSLDLLLKTNMMGKRFSKVKKRYNLDEIINFTSQIKDWMLKNYTGGDLTTLILQELFRDCCKNIKTDQLDFLKISKYFIKDLCEMAKKQGISLNICDN